MPEGYISIFQVTDTSNNRPHFKGFIKIDGVDHDFAVWPSRTGKGYTGKYKPKQAQAKPETPPPTPEEIMQHAVKEIDAGEIPF